MFVKFDSLVNCHQLAENLGRDDWLVFDCRFDLADVTRGEALYRESHIPGAVYAHLDHHLSSPITSQSGRHPMPDHSRLLNWLSQCGMQSSKQVVVYDDSYGAMAGRLWWLLKCLGHNNVALLDGGWQAWLGQEFQIDANEVNVQPAVYKAEQNPGCVISTQQVIDNLQDQDFLLVDVRTEERFRGISEPIDPVAGHIPGAVNIPLSRNLDPSGRFLAAEQLRELYAPVIARCEPKKQVYMCGSGVTACHSLIALSYAGYDMPRVYAGSWSEWIRDSARPIESDPGTDS